MKLVAQRDVAGCGVACVAFICKTSYAEAKKKCTGGSGITGYYCGDLVKALKKFGKNYSYKKVKKRGKIPVNSIVFIAKNAKYTNGHYVAKTSKGWMDPWINYPTLRAKAGYRKKLPGKRAWILFPVTLA